MSVPGKFLINIVIPKIFKMNLSGTKRTKLHPLNMGCQGLQSAPCLPKFRNNPLSTFFRLPSGSSETSIIRPPSLKIDRFKIVQHYKINITYFSVFVFFSLGGGGNEWGKPRSRVSCVWVGKWGQIWRGSTDEWAHLQRGKLMQKAVSYGPMNVDASQVHALEIGFWEGRM